MYKVFLFRTLMNTPDGCRPAHCRWAYYDYDSQLSYENARYYNPKMGRWASADAAYLAVGDPDQVQNLTGLPLALLLANPQTLNPYSYVENNPINGIDISGNSGFATWLNSTEGDLDAATTAAVTAVATAGEAIVATAAAVAGATTAVISGVVAIGLAIPTLNSANADLTPSEQKEHDDAQEQNVSKPTVKPLAPEDVRGKSEEEIDKITKEKGLEKQPTKPNGSTRYTDPNKPGSQLRTEPGNPNDPEPIKRGPYGRISGDGPGGGTKSGPIPLKGNPTLSQ